MNTSEVVKQYQGKSVPDLSYATVRDFCDSADHLSEIMRFDGDMKDVQRTWAIKAILGKMPIGSKLLEIGAGEPLVANALHQLGYHVTIVDPYDGAGNGPTAYLVYVAKYLHVKIIKAYFQECIPALTENSFDCIYSISVLEHVPHAKLREVFNGIAQILKPGGWSIHCTDLVLTGGGADWHDRGIREILFWQTKLQDPYLGENQIRQQIDEMMKEYYQKLALDVETYYHSAQGHNLWRGGRPYDEVPFCRIISTQTVAYKSV